MPLSAYPEPEPLRYRWLPTYLSVQFNISLNLVRPHDDVIKWKHFPRYWPFVWGIHRSPVNSPHKGQWRGALVFSLICVSINGWVNNGEAGDLRRYRAHYDVTVMLMPLLHTLQLWCSLPATSKQATLRPVMGYVIWRVSCQKGPICHA